jgi:hypothetical protein
LEDLLTTIHDETLERLLSKVIGELDAGNAVTFGRVAITPEGVESARLGGLAQIPWDTVEGLVTRGGEVFVWLSGKRRGQSLGRVSEIANPHVFSRVVKEIVERLPDSGPGLPGEPGNS